MINGKLREYDTKYPNYRVVMSPSNQKGIDFFRNIFNDKGAILCRFSLSGERLIASFLFL